MRKRVKKIRIFECVKCRNTFDIPKCKSVGRTAYKNFEMCLECRETDKKEKEEYRKKLAAMPTKIRRATRNGTKENVRRRDRKRRLKQSFLKVKKKVMRIFFFEIDKGKHNAPIYMTRSELEKRIEVAKKLKHQRVLSGYPDKGWEDNMQNKTPKRVYKLRIDL